jgi:hypothetical protein
MSDEIAAVNQYQYVTYLVIDVPSLLWICILQSLAKKAPLYYL